MPTVTLRPGVYKGLEHDGVDSFRGIPYAAPYKRFAGPEPLPPGDQTHHATQWGPICPQLPSRLAMVFGPMPSDSGIQDELNCAVLSVFTPSTKPAQPLPVIVFAHGGAFVNGGSQIPWYDGSRLAKDGHVVVVTINYRLGIFGFLPDESQELAPGCQDVIAAFEWVHSNIAEFGGDPRNITGFGQSAGAWHMRNLLSVRPDLLHRAILQSGPGAVGQTPEQRDRCRDLASTGLPSGTFLSEASVSELLETQVKAIEAMPGTLPPFQPTIDPTLHRLGEKKDILIGWTKDDGSCFAQLRGSDITVAGPLITHAIFKEPSKQLAQAYRLQGHDVTLFELTWAPSGFPLGATHCIDLPLVFGSKEAWKDAPMVGTTPWEEWERRGLELRKAWAAFARDGTKPKSWDGFEVPT